MKKRNKILHEAKTRLVAAFGDRIKEEVSCSGSRAWGNWSEEHLGATEHPLAKFPEIHKQQLPGPVHLYLKETPYPFALAYGSLLPLVAAYWFDLCMRSKSVQPTPILRNGHLPKPR